MTTPNAPLPYNPQLTLIPPAPTTTGPGHCQGGCGTTIIIDGQPTDQDTLYCRGCAHRRQQRRKRAQRHRQRLRGGP